MRKATSGWTAPVLVGMETVDRRHNDPANWTCPRQPEQYATPYSQAPSLAHQSRPHVRHHGVQPISPPHASPHPAQDNREPAGTASPDGSPPFPIVSHAHNSLVTWNYSRLLAILRTTTRYHSPPSTSPPDCSPLFVPSTEVVACFFFTVVLRFFFICGRAMLLAALRLLEQSLPLRRSTSLSVTCIHASSNPAIFHNTHSTGDEQKTIYSRGKTRVNEDGGPYSQLLEPSRRLPQLGSDHSQKYMSANHQRCCYSIPTSFVQMDVTGPTRAEQGGQSCTQGQGGGQPDAYPSSMS
ncbi:hypothetical protein OPT61_g700 [Boeremia exigua]|uniref:Uncharacterized protein n=1 Tax=Boeremia exigua TaxID=749465 RepID=A0ACC2ISU2_9PLEO|nr:hypothetical protein OPT61_g700 [Boeremia exigua]